MNALKVLLLVSLLLIFPFLLGFTQIVIILLLQTILGYYGFEAISYFVPPSMEAILHFAKTKKILGVCLGYQCVVEAYGGEIARLDSPKHGKVVTITHILDELFKGIPKEFEVCLYHSLHAKTLPTCLKSLAISKEGIEMALVHRIYPTFGVQFHPEAILSQYGKRLFENFLSL